MVAPIDLMFDLCQTGERKEVYPIFSTLIPYGCIKLSRNDFEFFQNRVKVYLELALILKNLQEHRLIIWEK